MMVKHITIEKADVSCFLAKSLSQFECFKQQYDSEGDQSKGEAQLKNRRAGPHSTTFFRNRPRQMPAWAPGVYRSHKCDCSPHAF